MCMCVEREREEKLRKKKDNHKKIIDLFTMIAKKIIYISTLDEILV
jgi:hypothetical protein